MDHRAIRGITFFQFSLWALAVASICCASTSTAAKYSVTMLNNAQGGTGTSAAGINNAGQVVGSAFLSEGSPPSDSSLSVAVVWNGKTPTVIGGSLPLYPAAASGINDTGLAVVNQSGVGATVVDTAHRFSVDLPENLGGRVFNALANGINKAGAIVGQDFVSNSAEFAQLWSGAPSSGYVEKNLEPLGDAFGINQSGQIVGVAGGHAALLNGKSITNLGTLGGSNSLALAINAAGRVAGWADTKSGDQHATLWNRGGTEDLGTLGGKTSSALAINAQGDIVGTSDHKGCCAPHAVLWPNDSNEMIDLNAEISAAESKEHTLTVAVGINDKGEIVVNGYNNKTFANESYVLNPSTPVCPAD
jgi:probable HAF family extracellular repeat protein